MNSVYDLEISDCHHHLWDIEKNDYPWLTTSTGPRVCGDYQSIRNKNFLLDDFFANRGDLNVTRFIHEEAVINRSDPVRETRWLQSIADQPKSEGIPHGIVAFADFSQSNIEAVLEAHQAYPNLRGIRQFVHEAYVDPDNPQTSLIEDANWRTNVGLCQKYDLVFDLQIYWQQTDDATKLVSQHPNLNFVLTHTGLPAQPDNAEYMSHWKASITRLAELPNLSVKLSGFGMFEKNWAPESIRPTVLHAIESFGAERCLFGSNFPVDSICGKSYANCWEGFFEVVRDFSDSEKRMLFSENTNRVYNV